MTLLAQFTIAAVFVGLAVSLGGNLHRRVILALNALGGGVIMFLIIKLVSEIMTRLSELFRNKPGAVSLAQNPWLFAAVTVAGLVVVPLILIFVVRERRRSIVLAIAFGLFNLTTTLIISTDTANGLYTLNAFSTTGVALLFLLEGVSIGALLIKNRPGPFYLLILGLTVSLPALAGFNLSAASNIDLIVPFAQTAAAGFMLFYLPFVLSAGKDEGDVKWQFIGMLSGMIVTGAILTALPILGSLTGY
jgi:hypothetical protein